MLELADRDFLLTEEVLASQGPVWDGYCWSVEDVPLVPIGQVKVKWIQKAARSVKYSQSAWVEVQKGERLTFSSNATVFRYQDSWMTAYHAAFCESRKKQSFKVYDPEPVELVDSETRLPSFLGDEGLDAVRFVAESKTRSLELAVDLLDSYRRIMVLAIGFPGGLPRENGPYVAWNGFVDAGNDWTRHGLAVIGGFSGSPLISYERQLLGIVTTRSEYVPMRRLGHMFL